ncbi:MAG: trypsin-like peptidase domain-containing protein [bacterium]|nr:trypsin-like peptidase domain-containing protein [bacterium]
MRRFYTYGPALLVLLTATMAIVAAPPVLRQIQIAQIQADVTRARAELDASSLLDQINAEKRAVANSVQPSVVHLDVTLQGEGNRRGFRSNGSAYVYDNVGHIVTNAHVVRDAVAIRAEFFDGRVMRAEIVGSDDRTDIAVLKVDAGSGVIPIRRATGEPLYVGDQVFAFGSPFGIKFSMSGGIVSGLGRSDGASFVNMVQGYTNFIQTDAAINPGNSGGPLVDVKGRLVGMNAAIANNREQFDRDSEQPAVQGQSAGIGFAIPLETIENVVDQLIESDVVLRGYLGVMLGNYEFVRRRLESEGFMGTGVLISQTPRNQPAAEAGLRDGDVVIAINNRDTPNIDVLRSIISVQQPGRAVDITVWRDGEPVTVSVPLGAAYDTDPRETGSTLQYVPGSEDMTVEQIRERVETRASSDDDDRS